MHLNRFWYCWYGGNFIKQFCKVYTVVYTKYVNIDLPSLLEISIQPFVLTFYFNRKAELVFIIKRQFSRINIPLVFKVPSIKKLGLYGKQYLRQYIISKQRDFVMNFIILKSNRKIRIDRSSPQYCYLDKYISTYRSEFQLSVSQWRKRSVPSLINSEVFYISI